MRVHLIYTLVSILSSVCGGRNNKFIFEMNTIEHSHIKLPQASEWSNKITRDEVKTHPFYRLDHTKQRKLCTAAIEHVSKNAVSLRRIDIQEKVDKFMIAREYETPTKTEEFIAVLCPTQPFLMLRLAENAVHVKRRPLKLSLRLVVQNNFFLNERYKFSLQTAKSIDCLTVADHSSKKDLRENYLFKLHKFRRWEMCIAAKNRIQGEHEVSLLEVPEDDWPETVGIYNIQYSNGTETKDVPALLCNSFPKMYLRATKENSLNDFIVLVEKNEIVRENLTTENV